MTRAAIVVALLALLLAGGSAPAAAREPEPASQAAAGRRAALVDSVIHAAESYLGLPYRVGREGPDIFDCSGLVYRVFADTGQVRRIGSARMRAAGYLRWFGARGGFVEDAALAERGDLVIYDAGKHIGIYLGKGEVISALVEGVTLHRIDGITLELSGILKVDWSGPGGKPMPHPQATEPPRSVGDAEAPASLIAPLPWLEPVGDDSPEPVAPLGDERVDMRTANSRTFADDSGSFTTEIFGAPVFYQPAGDDEWQPIDLRFSAAQGGGVVADRSPVTVELRPSGARRGFVRLAAGGAQVSLALPGSRAGGRAPSMPMLGPDGRFADYAELLGAGIGLRVFPRADGMKAFLVIAERPTHDEITFSIAGDGLTLAPEADGSIALQHSDADTAAPAPTIIGRIPSPLVLDSSDETGGGGALHVGGASLSVTESNGASLLTIALDGRALRRAEYPLFVDLSIVEFPSADAAAQHSFVSSRYPQAVLHGYQRPEEPAHAELWHGRLPGTPHYNEAFLRFPDLAETLGAATLEAASLRFYPYWQYDLDGPRPTWVSRVAQEWQPRTLSWDWRPAVDVELGRFETTAGGWSDIDVSGYVGDVLAGSAPDFGFRLHADGGGRGSWKRIVSDAGGTAAALPPRLAITWRELRPVAVAAAVQGPGLTLRWRHPLVAPAVTRYEVQLSTDAFATILASNRGRGRAAAEATWAVPAELLQPGVEHAWRVRASYAKGTPWSDWSAVQTFVPGGVPAGPLPLE